MEGGAGSRGLLLFRAAGRTFGVPAPVTRQVRPLGALTPLPGSQGALLGLSAPAGRAVPVADLGALLGALPGEAQAEGGSPAASLTPVASRTPAAPLLLLLEVGEQPLGLPIQEVIGFVESGAVPGEELLSPETQLGSYAEGRRGQLLNPVTLLGEVHRRLAAFQLT